MVEQSLGWTMENNVGGRDRTLRIVAGLALIGLSAATVAFGGDLGESNQILIAGVSLFLGAAALLTAGTRTCMINRALGRNTYGGDSDRNRPT